MSITLDRRVRQIRSRAAVRAWEYRQRRHADGVWYRLRRVLADAREAWAIPAGEAAALLDEGLPAEPVGSELEPGRTILFVPADRVARIPGRVAVPMRLGPELLGAEYLALVRFGDPGTVPERGAG